MLSKAQIIRALSDYVDATIIDSTIFSYYLDLVLKSVYWFIPLFYCYRYRVSTTAALESRPTYVFKDTESGRTGIGNSGSFDIRFLVASLLALSVWNGLLILFGDRVFLDLPAVIEFLKNDGSLLEPDTFHLWKDAKLLFVVVVSILLMNVFVIGILRLVPEPNELERKVDKEHIVSKSVSFDHFATYIYYDSSEDLTECPVELKPVQSESEWRFLKKLLCTFLTLLILSIFLLPNSFQLNSSSILVNIDSNFQIKSDHIFIALIGAFIYDSSAKLFISLTTSTISHKFRCLLPSAILISKFTWAYSCFILVISLSFLIIFNDVLFNLVHAIVNGSNVSSVSSSGAYPIQFISSILLNYLSHSSFNPHRSLSDMCSDVSDASTSYSTCIQTQTLNAYIASFYSLYLTMVNCWKVLNLFCFVLLAGIIWIIIEYKNARLRHYI